MSTNKNHSPSGHTAVITVFDTIDQAIPTIHAHLTIGEAVVLGTSAHHSVLWDKLLAAFDGDVRELQSALFYPVFISDLTEEKNFDFWVEQSRGKHPHSNVIAIRVVTPNE
jgi:hypothetical protein